LISNDRRDLRCFYWH